MEILLSHVDGYAYDGCNTESLKMSRISGCLAAPVISVQILDGVIASTCFAWLLQAQISQTGTHILFMSKTNPQSQQKLWGGDYSWPPECC